MNHGIIDLEYGHDSSIRMGSEFSPRTATVRLCALAVCMETNVLAVTEYPSTIHVYRFADMPPRRSAKEEEEDRMGRMGRMDRMDRMDRKEWEPAYSWAHAEGPNTGRIAFTPDGLLLVTTQADTNAPAKISVFDVETKTCLDTVWSSGGFDHPHADAVMVDKDQPCLGFGCPTDVTTSKELVAVSMVVDPWRKHPAESNIRIYSRTSRTSWTLIRVIKKYATALRFSPDGSSFIGMCGNDMVFHDLEGKETDVISIPGKGSGGGTEPTVLESYQDKWLTADACGCMYVVKKDRDTGKSTCDRITHGNTRAKSMATVPGDGVLILSRLDSIIMLRKPAHPL